MITSAEESYTSYLENVSATEGVDAGIVRETLEQMGYSESRINSILGDGRITSDTSGSSFSLSSGKALPPARQGIDSDTSVPASAVELAQSFSRGSSSRARNEMSALAHSATAGTSARSALPAPETEPPAKPDQALHNGSTGSAGSFHDFHTTIPKREWKAAAEPSVHRSSRGSKEVELFEYNEARKRVYERQLKAVRKILQQWRSDTDSSLTSPSFSASTLSSRSSLHMESTRDATTTTPTHPVRIRVLEYPQRRDLEGLDAYPGYHHVAPPPQMYWKDYGEDSSFSSFDTPERFAAPVVSHRTGLSDSNNTDSITEEEPLYFDPYGPPFSSPVTETFRRSRPTCAVLWNSQPAPVPTQHPILRQEPYPSRLDGPPINREPVDRSVAGARERLASSQTQRTSRAMGSVRGVAMRPPAVVSHALSYRSPYMGTTLPRNQRTDRVRRAQKYELQWRRDEHRLRQSQNDAVWQTRMNILAQHRRIEK